jgi:ABC-type polysaccharide/polyol phosphate export permease
LSNFVFGLPVLFAFLMYYRVPITAGDMVWLPLIVACQLLLTTGLALFVSALTVHFRDVRDLLQNLLMLWFFATPIIYPLSAVPAEFRPLLELNPFTHLAVAYQEVLFRPGPFVEWYRVGFAALAGLVSLVAGFFVFDRLRDTLAEEV